VNIPGAAAKKLVRRRTGLSGKPEPPWQLQRVLEFLDPETAERLSWPANVTVAGSSRAAEELEGRIRIVRRLRGEDVYPRVQLSHKFMPTQFGGRERPHLPIVGWVRFGEHGGLEAIETNVMPEAQRRITESKPQPAPMQSVSEVSLSEEMEDEVKF
jgi:hypothetical protein